MDWWQRLGRLPPNGRRIFNKIIGRCDHKADRQYSLMLICLKLCSFFLNSCHKSYRLLFHSWAAFNASSSPSFQKGLGDFLNWFFLRWTPRGKNPNVSVYPKCQLFFHPRLLVVIQKEEEEKKLHCVYNEPCWVLMTLWAPSQVIDHIFFVYVYTLGKVKAGREGKRH